MKRLLSAMLMAALMLATLSGPAFAEDVTKRVEELSAQAAAAYGEGEFEKAIELFQEAYELQPVPNLLFNIAKVYEKIEKWDEAEKNYKEFIKSPDADSQAREVALERIDAIKEIKAAAAAAEKPVEPEDKPEDPTEQPQPPPKESVNLLPWIVIGSGAVIAGTGAVFGILAMGKQNQFDEATTADEKRELRKSGKTFALVADISYGVGLAAGVVGVILLVTSGSSDSGAQQQAVVPTGWVGPNGQAGVGAMLRF